MRGISTGMGSRWARLGWAGGLMLAMSAIPAPAQAPGLAALAMIEKGDWELRERGTGDERRHICVTDPRQLLQVRHPGRLCPRFIVTDTPSRVVVTYDCGAAGNGRTDLRVETSRLVQLQSQGIANGAPFSFVMEGRLVGACR